MINGDDFKRLYCAHHFFLLLFTKKKKIRQKIEKKFQHTYKKNQQTCCANRKRKRNVHRILLKPKKKKIKSPSKPCGGRANLIEKLKTHKMRKMEINHQQRCCNTSEKMKERNKNAIQFESNIWTYKRR